MTKYNKKLSKKWVIRMRVLLLAFILLIVMDIDVLAYDFWQQNQTYFIKLTSLEAQRMNWQEKHPFSAEIIVNGTYFHRATRQPVALIKRWNEIQYDYPDHINCRPLICLPLEDNPYVTYNRASLGRWLISSGPTLISNYNIDIKCHEEQFRYDIRHSRKFSAIGIKDDGTVFIVVTLNRGLKDIAWCFKYLGCKNALRLDGGGSTYLQLGHHCIVGSRTCCQNYFFVT